MCPFCYFLFSSFSSLTWVNSVSFHRTPFSAFPSPTLALISLVQLVSQAHLSWPTALSTELLPERSLLKSVSEHVASIPKTPQWSSDTGGIKYQLFNHMCWVFSTCLSGLTHHLSLPSPTGKADLHGLPQLSLLPSGWVWPLGGIERYQNAERKIAGIFTLLPPFQPSCRSLYQKLQLQWCVVVAGGGP